MAVKIVQLHKRSSYEYQYIQDKYAYKIETNCYALADGTTQSFNSGLWAELITKTFIEKPSFEPTQLIKAFTDCAETFKNQKHDFSTNFAKASLQKEKIKNGGTSTFVGVQIFPNNQLSVVSCGDSNIFIFRRNEVLSIPFQTVDELDESKYFLNTEKLIANEIDSSFFIKNTISLQEKDTIILATDALSRLILKNPVTTCLELLRINDFDSLHGFCLRYWNQKELEEDDISAIFIDMSHSDRPPITTIIPPANFSFPKEAEIEFIPSQTIQSINKISDNEMQQLLPVINHLNQELTEIKSELKFHKILLAVLAMLMALMLFLYRVSSKTNNRNEILQQQVDSLENTVAVIKDSIKTQSEYIKLAATKIGNKEIEIIAKPDTAHKDTEKQDSTEFENRTKSKDGKQRTDKYNN